MHRRQLLKLAAFAIPSAWAQQVARPDWKPSFLDDHQNVNRYIDLFLRDGDPLQRASFIGGLNWFDGHSIQQHGHPFVHLTIAQQSALLQSLDTGTGPGRDFFQRAKFMTAGIYYNTKIGYQELNKHGRVPATFGCDHQTHA